MKEPRHWDARALLLGKGSGQPREQTLAPGSMVEISRRRRTNQIWYLYNFALWWKRNIRNEPVALG